MLLTRIHEAQIAAHPKQPLGTFVFPGPGEAGHRIELKRQWRTLCKAAGITGLRLHDLRHSYASALVSGGASLPLIGALLGHSNPATTSRYAHLYDDPLRAAAERIGSLIENAGVLPPAPPIPLRRGGGQS
jgi:integrase